MLGPRQIGKTTGVRLLLEDLPSYHYVSADGVVPKTGDWLIEQWAEAATQDACGLLVVDEVQKVEGWSEVVKQLWDEQQFKTNKLKFVVLGSSSLAIQAGLSESLAGRYFLHRVWPWSPEESRRAYGVSFETYLRAGGYPGSYRFVDPRSTEPSIEWLQYVRASIIDAVIGRDILVQHRVRSPALFRQAFDLVCSYGGREISYTKLLGQLQDRGNTDLVKHYLELFEGAYLLKQLYKYSGKPTLRRSSSPKILPGCPALYALTLNGRLDEAERGRAFEIAVGNLLCRKPGNLFYWRQGKHEVDYVHQFGKSLRAIEAKSGKKSQAKGLAEFKRQFPSAELLVLTPENYQRVIDSL